MQIKVAKKYDDYIFGRVYSKYDGKNENKQLNKFYCADYDPLDSE